MLDEAHAYRGIQATEIAFLVRRLKDRLGIEELTCIATSATLGKQGDEESELAGEQRGLECGRKKNANCELDCLKLYPSPAPITPLEKRKRRVVP